MRIDKLTADDNGSFGSTDEEYQFLLDDIDQAVEEGNKKYGYGGYGYIGKDGNYYLFPDNGKPQRSKPRPRPNEPSVEEVAIERGLIKIYHPTITINKEVDQ